MKAKQNRGSTNPLSPRALTASGRKSNLLSDKVVINTIMPPNTITLKKSQVRVQFKWEVRNTQWRIGIAMPELSLSLMSIYLSFDSVNCQGRRGDVL